MEVVRQWFRRYFSDPQVVILAVLLAGGFVLVSLIGDILAPVIASIVIAYLLEGIIQKVQRLGTPRFVAVLVVFLLFFFGMLAILFGLIPVLSRQTTQLFQQVPGMIAEGQKLLMALPKEYPNLISEGQVAQMIQSLREEVTELGQVVVSQSLSSLVNVITFTVYLVLMPLLVFFFLKDKEKILVWLQKYLPRDRRLAETVWSDVDIQIGNYIRGKFWEILIVWAAAFVVFSFMGLQFAVLLSLLVGLSVIVPYIGAVVVTFPILIIGFFQFGWSVELLYLMLAYGFIQLLDGNVLVPVLFSEVVDLHPVAIIVAVLFFGGIWGFWGVFFAIPLATLVQAVLKAWPRVEEVPDPGPQPDETSEESS